MHFYDGSLTPAPAIHVSTTLKASDEADLESTFGVQVSDVQSDIAVYGNSINGTSKYVEEVTTFDMSKGHNFLILHITADNATKIEACMDPTQGSGLVELDETGVVLFQLKPDKSQTVKIVATGEGGTTTRNLTIANLTLNEE